MASPEELSTNWTALASCELTWEGVPVPTRHPLTSERDREFIEQVLLPSAEGGAAGDMGKRASLVDKIAQHVRTHGQGAPAEAALATSFALILSAASKQSAEGLAFAHGRRGFRYTEAQLGEPGVIAALRLLALGLGDELEPDQIVPLVSIGFLIPEANLPSPVPAPAGVDDLFTGRAGTLASARDQLARHGFFTLRELLPPATREALARYFSRLSDEGLFSTLMEEDRKRVIHNEPSMRAYHGGLARLVSEVVGTELLPTYVFTVRYEQGAFLTEHVDRPQCEWNMSLVLDDTTLKTNPGERATWPFTIRVGEERQVVELTPGDAVVYRGTDMPHGRPTLEGAGRAVTVGIFHFVGPGFGGGMS